MRVRLRHLTLTRAGNPAVRDELIDVDVLSIGRGTDNRVQLPGLTVPLRHSQIRGGSGGLHVERLEPDRLQVNGRLVAGHVLRPGDVMDVGGFALRSLPPEDDEELLLEIERVRRSGSEAQAFRSRSRLGVEGRFFGRRFLSWAAIAVVGGCGVLWPYLSRRGGANAAWSTHAWATGPVARAHAGPTTTCEACHTTPFRRVDDGACLTCHQHTARHSAAVADSSTTPCTNCHTEHHGDARLLDLSAATCLRCHNAPLPGSKLSSVRAFDAGDGHPELSITVPTAPGARDCTRVPIAASSSGPERADPLIERAGLRFSHALHLRPGLRDRWDPAHAAGRVTLDCADCHRLDATGHFMQPVTFATNCQSCHDLAFSELDPSRQAPHPAAPDQVRTQVLEFFARAVLGDATPGAFPDRRRPGRDLPLPERRAALARADADATRALGDLLGDNGIDAANHRGACAVCHVFTAPGVIAPVARSGTAARCAETRPAATSSVYTPALTGRWMPGALFSHGDHATAPCAQCHTLATAAGPSGMLPGKAACVPCHGESTVGFATRSLADCGVCHRYHQPRHGALAAAR